MKIKEDVTIPLVSLTCESGITLLRWCVSGGAHVTIGQTIFEMEVGGAVYAIESMDSGHIEIKGIPGGGYQVGDVIGSILCDEPKLGTMIIGVELTHQQLAKLDSMRKDTPRRECLSMLIADLL